MGPIEAYLVGPPVSPAAPGPGLLFAHWYDPDAPNGNRTEIEHAGRLAPARLLFQFAEHDFYIAPMAGFEFRRAAGEGAEVKSYDAEHDMASPEARVDRTAFLASALGLAAPAP